MTKSVTKAVNKTVTKPVPKPVAKPVAKKVPKKEAKAGSKAAAKTAAKAPPPADELLPEIHPGEILAEEFLQPMGITSARLASDIDVPTSRISDIINGKRPVTVDTAMRFGLYFGMEARFWLNLQAEYDLRVAERNLLPQILARIRPLAT